MTSLEEEAFLALEREEKKMNLLRLAEEMRPLRQRIESVADIRNHSKGQVDARTKF